VGVLQTFVFSVERGSRGSVVVPIASVLARVLQTLQMSPRGRVLARLRAPGQTDPVGQHQTVEVAVQRGLGADDRLVGRASARDHV